LASASAHAAPLIRIGAKHIAQSQQGPDNAYCQANFQFECLSPADVQTAYGLTGLLNAGYTGVGETIVIIDAYGSPTIHADLKTFDAAYGIPDPPSFKVIAPLGTVPYDPAAQPDQFGWAFETTLDVEWAHAMAPGASIVLLTSPVDETEGVQGLPEFLKLEEYALDHHLGKIVSQSWGATENTLFYTAAGPQGPAVLAAFNALYQRGSQQGVTFLTGSGDSGSQNAATYSQTLGEPTSFYTFPTVNFPSTSPWVTSVGGTTLNLDSEDNYLNETVWNDDAIGAGAGGGGVSQLFPEPFYQLFSLPPAVQKQLHGHRGVPDIAFNADDYNSPVVVYASFGGLAFGPDFYLIGGTSEGSPAWAGIVADLNQLAGFPLGPLNPRLYAIGGLGQFGHYGRDVTLGNNAYGGVPGYNAGPGWDLTTGWGTPDLTRLPAWWASFSQMN